MGSGRCKLYPSLPDISSAENEITDTSGSSSGPINGKDFNTAGSSSVKEVSGKSTTNDLHSISQHGTPNSVSQNYKNGNLDSERYYDSNGDAYLDIDYTNHGNPKTHPHVPHEHAISFDESGNMDRKKEKKIQ